MFEISKKYTHACTHTPGDLPWLQVGLRHGPADLAAQRPAEGPEFAWHLRQCGGDQCGGRAPEEVPIGAPRLFS